MASRGSEQQRCGKSVDVVDGLVVVANAPLNCQDGNQPWRDDHHEAASYGYGSNDLEDFAHTALALGSAIGATIINAEVDYLCSL